MKDNNLIDELVADHKRVKSVPSIKVRFFTWAFICFLCLATGVSLLGLREDWEILFQHPLLLTQNITILLGVFVSGALGIRLSQPGGTSKKKVKKVLYGLSIIWILILLGIGTLSNASLDELGQFGFGCIKDILIIGGIPGIALFFFIQQGIVMERKITGFIAMVASFGLGAYGVQFTCHNDGALHILVWHFFPLILLGCSGVFFGQFFLKKL